MKKALAVLLALAMFIPCFSAISFPASAAVSEHVYMIVTNPGENMDTQMNIGWHADYTYTNCTVEYTTADDTAFAKATSVKGDYDDQAYKWFMDRSTTIAIGPDYFNTKFLDYGVTLSGLTPDTDYIYRISDGEGAYSETYAFKTAGQDEFSIMWTSDMHLDDSAAKKTKTTAVFNYLENLAKYDIGLHFNTGDQVASGDRHGFWQNLYDYDVMKKYTYAAAVGNHDLYDSMMKADPNYTKFWGSSEYFRIAANYPKNGYTHTSGRITGYLGDEYASYASKPANELFTVDSGSLAGKKISGAAEDTNGKSYWFIYNRMLFIVFDYYAMTYNGELPAAFDWAYGVIEANKGKYDYLIASEHLNIWWGGDGTSRYYDRYKDFLTKANVDLFFCGDNHVYFRTNPLLEGAVTTDPEKGTIFLQASAITNTSTYGLHSGPVGVGVTRYADADYLGGAVIDVDANGMHLTVATGSGNGDNLAVFETVDIPKKVRYADATVGIYKNTADLTLYETSELNSAVLKTIPADTTFEVYAADGIWGKIRYEGMSGWARMANVECLCAVAEPSTHKSVELTGYNTKYADPGGLFAYTPGYGPTIANGGWSYKYNYVYIADKQADGSYTISSINTAQEAKNETPTSDTTVVLMANSGTGDDLADTLVVGFNFTLDWAQNALNAVDATEKAPEYVLHEVTYYGKDGAYLGKNKVLDGQAANIIEAPVVEGYTFTGWDKNYSKVTADLTLTAIYKADIALGDVNGDGKINSLDAAKILKFDAELVTLTDSEKAAADVNGDGKVNSLDASKILKFDAGIIKEF